MNIWTNYQIPKISYNQKHFEYVHIPRQTKTLAKKIEHIFENRSKQFAEEENDANLKRSDLWRL